MKSRFLLLPFLALLAPSCASPKPDYGRPLPPGAPSLIPLAPDEPMPDLGSQWRERSEILPALDRSIHWMQKPSAKRFFPVAGITYDRALQSLVRFREVLVTSRSSFELRRRIEREFTIFKSAGWDGLGGGVLFTGYCTPVLDGRLEADARHRWPLYAMPPDLVKGPDGEILGRRTPAGIEPYPTRREIETSGILRGKGLELAWLRDPVDAYIAHVNGSAFVRLEDGRLLRLGYAGKNGRPYTSLGMELVRDGKLRAEEVSLATIRQWAARNPEEVEEYLHRNPSYVFFTPIEGNPRGSLNEEVTPGRTIATDKTLFPRGALVFVETRLPERDPFERLLLDQDTGGAIRTAGRADLYFGVGDEAERIAGGTRAEGQMYYLFLRGERGAERSAVGVGAGE